MGAARVIGGRYELIRPIGRGGMGEVWAGLDTRLDRRVAVKLLRPNALPAGVDQDVLIARFAREARLTARLEHPGVPAVHDTGTDSGDLYLVMQLIEGADLADFQAENEPVPIGWVAAAGAQVAAVLTAAHAVGLVHRDLKPRNVMITLDGHVKVLDFGLAVLRDGDGTKITRTAESLGTPAYMAPEQAMTATTSPASDIYSLGCVLYELITGQPVFTANTPLALMHRHYSEIPEPITTLRPDAGPALTELVARMLAKHPDHRPTAPETHALLAAVIPPTAPGPDLPMDPTRPFHSRTPAPQHTPDPPTGPHLPIGPGHPTTFAAPPIGPLALPRYPVPAHPTAPLEPPRPGFLEGAKRAGDGFFLVCSLVWVGFGVITLTTTADTTTGVVGLVTGLILVLGAAQVRKVRLGYQHLWTIGRLRDGPPWPAGWAELTGAITLLAIGALFLLVAVADTISLIGRQAQARSLYQVLSGYLIAAALVVPGAIMALRRRARGGRPAHRPALPPPSAGQAGSARPSGAPRRPTW